jgi:hypothetical protein
MRQSGPTRFKARNARALRGLWCRVDNGSTRRLSILQRNEAKMTNLLDLFLAYPHGLIVTGTVLLILGLVGLALFSRRDVDSTEDLLEDRPKLSDKETQ